MKGEDPYKVIRWLIWLYLALLIFEGALRKWVVPGMSNALLIARDPVVLLIYLAAIALRCFPSKNVWIIALVALACLTFAGGFLAQRVNLLVMAYGMRTNFLHLPLIFVMARVLTIEDIKWMGKWILMLSVPMAVLMLAQFQVGPGHWLNVAAGGTGTQIGSAMSKVRAAGTFSFITGPVSFYSLVAALLLYGQLHKKVYPLWLTVSASIALLLAAAASGSRSLLGGVVVVGGAFFVGLLLHPPSMTKAFRIVILAGAAYLVAGLFDIYQEASDVMKARIEIAAHGKSQYDAIVGRFLAAFSMPIFSVPLFGHGLGLGTNAGAAMLGVRGRFLLAESEWLRVLMESGSFLGPAFLFYRIFLFVKLGLISLTQARAGNLFPILLLGSGGLLIVNGQFGPPTILGFAVFTGGACMAAANVGRASTPSKRVDLEEPKKGSTGGRKISTPPVALIGVGQPLEKASPPPKPIGQPGRWAVRPGSTKSDVR